MLLFELIMIRIFFLCRILLVLGVIIICLFFLILIILILKELWKFKLIRFFLRKCGLDIEILIRLYLFDNLR